MINKKNIPLYIAIAVPLLMIVLVAAFIYLPGIGAHPQHNFLYMTGTNDYYPYGSRKYQVQNGHLAENPLPSPTPSAYPTPVVETAHFYEYDVEKQQATEISFAQAQNLTLDPSTTSDDGYIIQQGNYSGGDMFFGGGGGGDYNSWFIKGHNRSRKLNLKLVGPTYYDFQFLGWIQ